MTYSIIARCQRTGRLGIGTTTFSLACGRRNESVRANVGIAKSQAMYMRAHDPRSLNLLAQGFAPASVMKIIEENDSDFAYRQTGIIDREGNVAVHTGAKCGPWAGHHVGDGFGTFGNGLAGPQTIEGLVAGFSKSPDAPLEDRLLEALEGGRDAGGQATNGVPRPERSAWLCIIDRGDVPEINLRVDLHDKTVAELRRLLTEFRGYRKFYETLANDPADALADARFASLRA
jgi:uncharacterized Ntn-hydrolase superfamily protein